MATHPTPSARWRRHRCPEATDANAAMQLLGTLRAELAAASPLRLEAIAGKIRALRSGRRTPTAPPPISENP